jgi:NAD(P)-dependent dehydrogenase (short-subunit alcohol dehydrogenase family)
MYEISADWLNAISCVREMSQALFSLVGLTRVLFLCCTAVISHQWWSNQICILTFGALVAIAHVGSRQLIDWLLFSTQMMYRASAGAVLITGASRGMGRAASLHLAKSGFRVFAAVRRREDGEQLTRQATEAQCQGSIEVVVLDVCDDESVRTAAASIQKELADDCMPLVAVINNAGYMHLGPVEGVAVSAMRHTFDTNLFGVQRVCKAFAPLLRSTARDWLNASGNGALRPRLINISSIASFARAGYQGVYSSSKAAVDVLNEAMRQELEPHGVDVVLVSPYFIDSDMGAQWRDPAQRQAMIDELVRRLIALFLHSSYITNRYLLAISVARASKVFMHWRHCPTRRCGAKSRI